MIAFLEDLAVRARPHAERDWMELRAFAATELGMPELQPWDSTFAAERLRQQRYSFSENEVKQYFPQEAVLKGLFKVTETLFGVSIRRDEATVWNPDVRFFRVENKDGSLVAQFYLDLYAREGKRGGAWMDDARSRHKRREGGVQTPRVFDLQFLRARRWKTRLLYARRSHHPVPRIRARLASHADARR